MKHLLMIIAAVFMCSIHSMAQSGEVKDAAKSVFKLTTYKADGTVLAEGNGVFTAEDGIAISALKPFLGAARATITAENGKTAEVVRMLGADELYDMAKFRVDGMKVKPLQISKTPAKTGDEVWLVMSGDKNVKPVKASVKSVETFMDKYSYYIFSMQTPDGSVGCPFVNSQGQVLGLMKPSTTSTDIHATDANYATDLHTTGFAINDPALLQIGIPPALPNELDQAQLVLIMAEQVNDSVKLPAVTNDFINAYPALIDGYSVLARMQVNSRNFKDAAKTMETAIKKVENKADAHAAYGKIIYDKLIYMTDVPYDDWTLDKAAEETNLAYQINPLPTYQHQQAQIIFAQGDYQKAYDTFIGLLDTPLRSPELFYEASRCKTMLKAPQTEIISLLDSAINTTDTLRIREAAPYFLARAEAYNAADSFRQAVFDYTRYEILMDGRVNAPFYYVRAQTEIKARLYQQALSDMAAAITIAPKEPTYYAEMASLQLRVNLIDDALKTASACVELAPEYSDGYLLLGLAQVGKGDKTSALTNLEKAKELGNPQAQPLIDKYSKE